ncbi:MAG: MFS transporter, partial [Propionibacteriaceae bacterium]|nr:MFS transporter [Propionibacteriaceae bacterium]
MEPLRRDAQTWACYALILALAVLQGGLGGLLPFIQAEFGFSHTVLSLHITAMAVGGLIAGSITDRVRRRVGRLAVLLATVVLAALGGLLLVAGRSAIWTVSAAVLLGVAVVGALIVAQALLVEKYGPISSRLIGEFNLGYAIGAVVAMFSL